MYNNTCTMNARQHYYGEERASRIFAFGAIATSQKHVSFQERIAEHDGDECDVEYADIIEEHERPGRILARMQHASHPERTSESQAALSKKDKGVDMVSKC